MAIETKEESGEKKSTILFIISVLGELSDDTRI